MRAVLFVFAFVVATVASANRAHACLERPEFQNNGRERARPLRGVVFRARWALDPDTIASTNRHVRTSSRFVSRDSVRIDYEADADSELHLGEMTLDLHSIAPVPRRPRHVTLTRSDNGRCNYVYIGLDQPVAALRVRVTRAGLVEDQWLVDHDIRRPRQRVTELSTAPICASPTGPTVLQLFAILDDGREVAVNGPVDYASIPIRTIENAVNNNTSWELDLAVSRAALLALLALIFARLALPRVAIGDASLYGHRWSVLFRRLLPRARVVRRRR
jgi:hypothetical protein